MLLQKFLAGARQAGAATETIYLRAKHINHCHGCFNCWLKSKGRCIQALSLTMSMIFGALLSAGIYRHSSEFFFVPRFYPQIKQVLSALAQAGEEVVHHGKVDPLTMDKITQDLTPRQELIQLANEFWMRGKEKTTPDIDGLEHHISKWV